MAQLQKATNAVVQEVTGGEERFKQATAGLYRHPQSGAELAASYDKYSGNAQAEGLVRVGFERVGDIPTGYDKSVAASFSEDVSKGPVLAASDEYKGLLARIKQLEDEKNVKEATEAKKDDKSSDEAPEVQLESVKAAGEAKVADAASAEPTGITKQ